jgi:hypothetical protein
MAAPRGANGIPFEEHEELVVARPAIMGGSNLLAVFIDEALRTGAKSSSGAIGKFLEMRLERSRRQPVIRIEKDQEVSGTLVKTEVSGSRAAAIFGS